MNNEVKLLLNIDIHDDRPGKAVRLYTHKGKLIGKGIQIIKTEQSDDLFIKGGYINYDILIEDVIELARSIKEQYDGDD